MIKREIREYVSDGTLYIAFRGCYDYLEFDEVIRTLREEIRVDCVRISGLSAMDGYSEKDGIRLSWVFNNWDCIEASYDDPTNLEAVAKIREWAKIIFNNLIKKFGEYYT